MARTRTRKKPADEAADTSAKGARTREKKEEVVDKRTEIEKIRDEIRKEKGTHKVTTANVVVPCNHIPTGCFTLDFALLGGVADGYVTMIYGPESSGKTFLSKKTIASYQRKYLDKQCLYIDMEGMYDKDWAAVLGVDNERVDYLRPDHGNEAIDMLDAYMSAWETGLIVIDSVPAMIPLEIAEKSAEDDTMAMLARLMSKMCSKILVNMNREATRGHRMTVILLNQWRTKVGMVFGDPRQLPGGRWINHLPTTKIELKSRETAGKDKYGMDVTETVDFTFSLTKTKGGRSIKSGEFRLMVNPDSETGVPYGQIDDAATIRTFAKRMGLVTGGGSKWAIDGVDQSFRTMDSIDAFLRDNSDERLSLAQAVIALQRTDKGLPMLPPDGYLLDWAEVA